MIKKSTIDLGTHSKIFRTYSNGTIDIRIVSKVFGHLDDLNGEPAYMSYYKENVPKTFVYYNNGHAYNINKNHPTSIEWDTKGGYTFKFYSKSGIKNDLKFPSIIHYDKNGDIINQYYYTGGVCRKKDNFCK